MSKISKRSLLTGVIVILLMLTYSLAFCLYCFMWRPNVDTNINMLWVTYAFTMGIFTVAFITAVLAFERSDLRSRVFGVPIVLVGFGAMIIQIAIDIVIMTIGVFVRFSDISWIFVIVPEVLFLVFAIITIIVRQAYRGLIEKVDALDKKTDFVNNLLVNIEIISKTNHIAKLDKELTKLYEAARYSDPVSMKEVEDVEDKIMSDVDLLRSEVSTGDYDASLEVSNRLIGLISERAIRLKAAKRK